MSCRNCSIFKREIAQLRKEMADLRALISAHFLVSEQEAVIDVAKEENDGWKTQRCKKFRPHVKKPEPLETRNSFSALSDIDEPLVDPQVLMIGDSMLRDQGVIFNRRCKKKAFVKCFPGAGIDMVASAIPRDDLAHQVTVVSVGTNDVKNSTLAAVKLRYREMLSKLRERRSPTILMGILPRLRVTKDWTNRAREINRWLHEKCVESNVIFINLWDYFSSRKYLYKQDGVHLKISGKNYISNVIDDIASERALYNSFL